MDLKIIGVTRLLLLSSNQYHRHGGLWWA